MRTVVDYLTVNWSLIVIPVAVFAFSLIALFWLRKFGLGHLTKWIKKANWEDDNILMNSIRGPSSLFCLALSIYLGITVSSIPETWKIPLGHVIWTLFLLALAMALLSLTHGLIMYYGRKLDLPPRAVLLTYNVTRIVILIIVILIILDVWGVPTSPLLLLIAIMVLVAVIAFRDAVPNLFASFHMAATQTIKVGDYVKLDTKEEGYVTSMSWNATAIRSLDGSSILIPNNQLIHRKVINYGHPLKKAREPFYFNTRVHMAELTGLKASNLREMAAILKKSPESVIYYHTHHFLEDHQYLIPELSNDFAIWVKDALGNPVLAEKLANVNTFEFTSLSLLRESLLNIIEENAGEESFQHEAAPGREFYFMNSISVILPTPYAAHDLREFIEALRKISPSSLYFHVFESRLRLGKGLNDFSIWLEVDMDEMELSREIARIDPYNFTLEGLRSVLIQTIEKRIK
ncbi:MAG: mechanosensitive ion channel family protein [Dehalococcoidales bacterium]|nr:mechanosensitive ion channel family protein [Dehalococcoidales bacterium]